MFGDAHIYPRKVRWCINKTKPTRIWSA